MTNVTRSLWLTIVFRLGHRSWKKFAAVGLALTFSVAALPVTAHLDPPGNVMTDDAQISSVMLHQDFDDPWFAFDGEAEICVIAVFYHGDAANPHNHMLPPNPGPLPGLGPAPGVHYQALYSCRDINMDPAPPAGVFDALAAPLAVVTHRECTPRADWITEVRAYEDDEDIRQIVALIDASIAIAKLVPKAQEGAALAKVIWSIVKLFIDTADDDLGFVILAVPGSATAPESDSMTEQLGNRFTATLDVTEAATTDPCPANDTPEAPGEGPDGEDGNHPFSKNVTVAQASWNDLHDTIPVIDSFGMGSSEVEFHEVPYHTRTAIDMVSQVGQATAQAEVEEAERSRIVSHRARAARQALEEGNLLRLQAIETLDTVALAQSLDRYEYAFAIVAECLHPEHNPPPTEQCFDAGVPTLSEWGFLGLGVALAGFGVVAVRRRKA